MPIFASFSKRAQLAIKLARDAAAAQKQPFVGTMHLLLVAVVTGKILVVRIRSIGPGLMQDNLRGGGQVLTEKTQQLGQRGGITIVDARLTTHLLHTHIIPLFVPQGLHQRSPFAFALATVTIDFAVGVGRAIVTGILHVTFERAATYIHIGHDGLDALGGGQFVEVLFDGILREAVSDGQDANRLAGREALCCHQQQKAQKIKVFHGVEF